MKMPIRRTYRKRTTRKPMYKRKRYTRKRMIPRSLAAKSYNFKRMAAPAVLLPSGLNTVYGVVSFNMSQLPNVTELSSLFDRYRINKVVTKIWIRNSPESQSLNNGNNSWFPKMYWFRDVDDTSAPISLTEFRVRGHTKVKVMSPYRPITIVTTPNTLQENYNGVGTSSYTPQYKKWIDFDYPGTLHLGWKWAIDGIPSTGANLAPYTFDFEHTYYFSCRDVL